MDNKNKHILIKKQISWVIRVSITRDATLEGMARDHLTEKLRLGEQR